LRLATSSESKETGKKLDFLTRGYFFLVSASNWLQGLVLLIFRLTWGWQFFLTGQGKIEHHAKTAEFFSGLNIPFPDQNAWMVGGLELAGGVLLMAGLASRPVGLLLTVNMIVAYLSVEDDRMKVLNMVTKPEDFLQADPFFFLLTSLLVLAFGAGIFSVDAILARTVFSKYNVR
jgi:putative oxidoreductase